MARYSHQAEWLDTIPGNGYRIRKFRYEVVPGMWVAGLLYEPSALRGRVPVVLNLNGHEEEGMASPYIQERCVHLARNGVLAFNTEWFGRGQMSRPGFDHYRLNQIDLTGSSGLALFYLAQTRLLDIALKHPHADAARVAVTGFSGGGWQTLLLASMDLRVAAAVPVAGYSSFLTRTQFPELDLGDSEQTPVDLGLYADYTHLTALLAPRPTLLIYNARDNCCFRADYALPPLLEAARPVFDLYGRAGRLRDHVGFDVGHNDGPDDRRALYGFLSDVFFEGKGSFSTEETTICRRLPECGRTARAGPRPERGLPHSGRPARQGSPARRRRARRAGGADLLAEPVSPQASRAGALARLHRSGAGGVVARRRRAADHCLAAFSRSGLDRALGRVRARGSRRHDALSSEMRAGQSWRARSSRSCSAGSGS